ncbi:carbohydrate ABC transporter membrane protein 2 (CUT1 family) [Propionicimonas paludicola]|uniref:Carbohydrate ABC transporter membrane protein 2 (CUT1 family) n=1 Tax=Propionicimonas paludicola TaxID=185243 RepID=A0A2A9CVF6_9ACTN|nr:carbohydrate ABC transporter permease [Propionicimonas paludicola]PFG18388.1 carbohydrate ABC transporter membrane protein 2 (CUT1 family) [Propionicimonas paludicola]
MTRTQSRRRARERVATVLIAVPLTLGALACALPFVWMVANSVKTRSEAVSYPPHLLPSRWTFAAYAKLFTELDFSRYTLNTVALVAIGLVGLLLTAMAGYGFAKFPGRALGWGFFAVLLTMMIPAQVTMIPTYLVVNAAGLTNNLVGIALPTLVSAFGVFLFRQFMITIPDSLLEAARIDGASELRIFFAIALPVSRPILIVQGLLTVIASWNSFLWPLILSSSQRTYTLSVGLSLLNKQITTDPTVQMAGAALMTLPIIVLFFLAQRHIVAGFTMSGIK